MRRAGDIALLVVQWILILHGVVLILIALQSYTIDATLALSVPEPMPGQATFRVPILQRLVQGVTTGLVATGLGAMLFYLRQIYLSGRP